MQKTRGQEEVKTSPDRVRVTGPLSQDQVAALLGMTRQGVQRAEQVAMQKLLIGLKRLAMEEATMRGVANVPTRKAA
jgi:hypothetical protein